MARLIDILDCHHSLCAGLLVGVFLAHWKLLHPDGDLHMPMKVDVIRRDKIRSMLEIEFDAIEIALNHFNGNLTEAAKALKISRQTIYRRLAAFNVSRV